MFLHHIIQTLFVIAGVTAILAALFDWEWFFTSENAAPVVRKLGRKGGRLLYALAGILLVAAAIGFYYYVKSNSSI